MLSGISDIVVNRLIIKEKRNNNLPECCPKLSDVARNKTERLFGVSGNIGQNKPNVRS